MSARTISFQLTQMLFAGLVVLATSAFVSADEHGQKVLAKFSKHVANHATLTDAQKSDIEAKLKESADDPQYAITEGLVVMFPKYAAAIETSDANQVDDAVKALVPMTGSEDQYLAADAAFVLARMLMNNERFEEAVPQLERLTSEMADHTAHRGAAQYYMGVAQAGLLKNKAAVQSFMTFLQSNPDAPERLIVNAWQQVQELQAIQAGQLVDVHQRMDYSRRRLAQQETGDSTQEQQDKIITMLNKLIKQAEKKECSNCKGGKSDKPGKKSGKKQAQSKPGQSKQGGSSSNPNGEAIVKNYDGSPASPWSRLRERSRDPANNAVKEKLPARYREIVERYIKAANGEK